MNKIKAGIVGAAGYTGGEMIRILLNHPDVQIHFIQSSSSAGKFLYEVHTDLLGDTELKFDAGLIPGADVIFLCVGHGDARKFLNANNLESTVRIIDLSQDFRLEPATFHAGNQSGMGGEIQAGLPFDNQSGMGGENQSERQSESRSFTYGLPALNRTAIRQAGNIANPGCFATAIQLALLPLASSALLKNDIHISAVTGSTGAGQSLAPSTHFTWRENNLSVYKAFTHQHLGEINRSLKQLQPDFKAAINFIPYRGDFTRGIIASVYTDTDLSYDQAFELYTAYYESDPFTWVSASAIDLKQVVNTNKVFLSLQKQDGKLLIISILDNLLKGASGQAVENMNLMFGKDERAGLNLKAIVF